MKNSKTNWTNLLLLILAGEGIFILPFVLQRVFRATVLDVFQITNTELGLCFTAYGLVAMASYLFGGPVADRYEPRKLIAIALWSTALGGILYAQFPGFRTLQMLYAYWGFTSIFLFWSAMLKATRILGGSENQSRAFGFLDGGRGAVAVFISLVAVGVFASEVALPGEMTMVERRAAFRMTIYVSSVFIALIGMAIWFLLKADSEEEVQLERLEIGKLVEVLKLPAVWLLMGIVLCAYVSYKTTDIVSLYAKEVLNYDEVKAAQIATFMLVVRPIAGFLVGIYGDRLNAVRLLLVSFLTIIIGSLWFALGLGHAIWIIFMLSIFVLAMGVYAARALYFAVQREGSIPLKLSGTAVGLVSVIGFTPDVFAGVMIGAILDEYPGQAGHQYVFLLLALFAIIGSLCVWKYGRLKKVKVN